MCEERKQRGWPLLVYGKTQVIHISNFNAPGCKACTECGREVNYISTYTDSSCNPEELRAAKDGILKSKYGWQGDFKLCARCGTPEDFATALEDYRRLHGAFMEKMDKENQFVQDHLEKTQREISEKMKEIVEDGFGDDASDITQKGFGIEFTLTLPEGTKLRMELGPTDDEGRDMNIRARVHARELYTQQKEADNVPDKT